MMTWKECGSGGGDLF